MTWSLETSSWQGHSPWSRVSGFLGTAISALCSSEMLCCSLQMYPRSSRNHTSLFLFFNNPLLLLDAKMFPGSGTDVPRVTSCHCLCSGVA